MSNDKYAACRQCGHVQKSHRTIKTRQLDGGKFEVYSRCRKCRAEIHGFYSSQHLQMLIKRGIELAKTPGHEAKIKQLSAEYQAGFAALNPGHAAHLERMKQIIKEWEQAK